MQLPLQDNLMPHMRCSKVPGIAIIEFSSWLPLSTTAESFHSFFSLLFCSRRNRGVKFSPGRMESAVFSGEKSSSSMGKAGWGRTERFPSIDPCFLHQSLEHHWILPLSYWFLLGNIWWFFSSASRTLLLLLLLICASLFYLSGVKG